MKKFLVPLFVLLLGTGAFAAEKEKIGFVNLQVALNESAVGKAAKAELEEIIKRKQDDVETRIKAKDAFKEEIEKQSAVLSEDARRSKAGELQRMEREIERLVADTNADLQKLQRDKEVRILKDMDDIIRRFGKEHGYTVIFPSDVLLYAAEGLDVTAAIVEEFDKAKAKEAPK